MAAAGTAGAGGAPGGGGVGGGMPSGISFDIRGADGGGGGGAGGAELDGSGLAIDLAMVAGAADCRLDGGSMLPKS